MSGARNSDPNTSHRAAARVDSTRLQKLVLATLLKVGVRGATTKEIAVMTGNIRDTISPRMVDLEAKGCIARTHDRREGCIVWVETLSPLV